MKPWRTPACAATSWMEPAPPFSLVRSCTIFSVSSRRAKQRDEINPYVAMGTSVSSLANRISYDFNLKGPSISLDTACSSSLVAVHLACRSLWSGDADMAIAAGVNVMLRPETSIILSKAGFLSPDQYCKAFDAAANGYVRGEGVGVVILKPLSKALADGDAIYACVLGTGVNQDGYLPEGFTVPNVMAQIALLKAVYAEARVDPLTVDFVEAHGTGTPVGDPIESFALGTVLGRGRSRGQCCLLGSVKTNLGHLEGAAGIAGFIKGTLVAHHGVVPPNLHLHNPNPAIDWEAEKLQVPTRSMPLPRGPSLDRGGEFVWGWWHQCSRRSTGVRRCQATKSQQIPSLQRPGRRQLASNGQRDRVHAKRRPPRLVTRTGSAACGLLEHRTAPA